MPRAVRLIQEMIDGARQVAFRRHMLSTTPDGVTLTATTGTVAVLDEPGGGVSLTTQAADNAIATLTTVGKLAKPATNKPIHIAMRLQFSEAATNAGNVLFGLASGAVASVLQNDGAGPPASYSGFVFFKEDGQTLWSTEASVAGTQSTVQLSAANSANGVAQVAGSAAYQLLEIDIIPKSATKCDVVFCINGACVRKITDFTYTSVAQMAVVAAVKAGSVTAEVLKVTYLDFVQAL